MSTPDSSSVVETALVATNVEEPKKVAVKAKKSRRMARKQIAKARVPVVDFVPSVTASVPEATVAQVPEVVAQVAPEPVEEASPTVGNFFIRHIEWGGYLLILGGAGYLLVARRKHQA